MPADATCFICQVGAAGDEYGKPPEGLVRGCACRGSMGVAHVSCLVRQARLRSEDSIGQEGSMDVWDVCLLCKQQYHGAVCLALGWACWKEFEPRPQQDELRGRATIKLGAALGRNYKWIEAISVFKAGIYLYEKIHVVANIQANFGRLLSLQGNLARCYESCGRLEEALRIMRTVYRTQRECNGVDQYTISYGINLANMLMKNDQIEEALVLQRENLPLARELFGPTSNYTLTSTTNYCVSVLAHAKVKGLSRLDDAERAEYDAVPGLLREAYATLLQVFGQGHPETVMVRKILVDFGLG